MKRDEKTRKKKNCFHWNVKIQRERRYEMVERILADKREKNEIRRYENIVKYLKSSNDENSFPKLMHLQRGILKFTPCESFRYQIQFSSSVLVFCSSFIPISRMVVIKKKKKTPTHTKISTKIHLPWVGKEDFPCWQSEDFFSHTKRIHNCNSVGGARTAD